MSKRDVDLIFREHMDLDDRETLKVLASINEADQNQVLYNLCGKLYEKLIDKVDDIDFGEIPSTKGDITKLSNYTNMMECVDILKNLLKEFKESTSTILEVEKAINNIKKRKELFQKGFRYNVELPIVIYSTMTLSVISSISFLISSCVEYIKMPNKDSFGIVVDRVALVKSKDNLLFKNLSRFNEACVKGQIDTAINDVMKGLEKGFVGEYGFLVGATALVVLITCIIPLLRELIFFFYYSRTRLSDYFEVQANLLQMNIYNLQSNQEIDKDKKTKIIKKQSKLVDKFRKISNFFAVKAKESENKTDRDIAHDNTKYKTNDVLDSLPDSADTSLF